MNPFDLVPDVIAYRVYDVADEPAGYALAAAVVFAAKRRRP